LKAFVDQEFQDVQFEAEDLLEGWAQQIWPQAMQFHTVEYDMYTYIMYLLFHNHSFNKIRNLKVVIIDNS
jgi:hypothetical protein